MKQLGEFRLRCSHKTQDRDRSGVIFAAGKLYVNLHDTEKGVFQAKVELLSGAPRLDQRYALTAYADVDNQSITVDVHFLREDHKLEWITITVHVSQVIFVENK